MKMQAMASALRCTLSPTEADDIAALAHRAEAQGIDIPYRLTETLAMFSVGAFEVRQNQSRKRAVRDSEKRREAERRAHEHHAMLGDFNITADLGDFIDSASSPDYSVWADLSLMEAVGDPIPEQREIRRNVWRVRVSWNRPGELPPGEYRTVFVGTGCTDAADRAQIDAVATQIIAKWQVPA